MKIILFIILSILSAQEDYYLDFEIIVNENPLSENIFIHSMGSSGINRYMAILGPDLTPIWYVNSGDYGIDFKVNNNQLSYFNKLGQYWTILDSFMQEADTLGWINGYGYDYHDFLILENGEYITLTYDSLYVDMSQIVQGGSSFAMINGIGLIEEYDQNHNLLYEWNAWDRLDISDYTHLDLTLDQIAWMHVNSIEIDHDNNLIVSDRVSSQILKINWPDGNLIWTLGGPMSDFIFVNDSLSGPLLQHDVRRLDNGSILMYDNHVTNQINDNTPSRAVEYQLDEDAYIAELVWEYFHPEGFVGLAMGSAQRLSNQNTLINWGLVPGYGTIFTEVDYEKNIVLDIRYPIGSQSYKIRKDSWSFDINLITGDSNLDSIVDILDIMYLVNYILFSTDEFDMFHLFKVDINKDANINISDIMLMVNMVLN